jgi:4-hydroxy-tetrahydrodipicolinate synthase
VNWYFTVSGRRLVAMMLSGLYVPLITPFDRTGGVALDALAALAHETLDAGADGLVALGTTAEPSSLTEAEQAAVVDVVARACRDRGRHLIVGASSRAALTALGDRTEVTAALCVVPAFVRPGEAGVIAYFTQVAAASPVPIVVYDIPYRTAQYLSAATLRRLAAIPGVVGLKYAPGGITEETIALLAEPPAGLSILGGDDPYVSAILALGAHGGILASAHVATAEFRQLIDTWQAGDTASARVLGHRLSLVSLALFAEPNPTVIKAVLHAQGRIPSPAVRLPLLPAGEGTTMGAGRRLEAVTPVFAATVSS